VWPRGGLRIAAKLRGPVGARRIVVIVDTSGTTASGKAGSIAGMKVSVSLPAEDVAYIDEYAQRVGAQSRSSVLHEAVALLRMSELESAYAEAFREWHESADRDLWDNTVSDGLADAPR
jgi:Arc/MetJ-type ribon-helix-helix transcriptional regulator